MNWPSKEVVGGNDAKVIHDLILSSFRPRMSSDLSASKRKQCPQKARPLSFGGEPLSSNARDCNNIVLQITEEDDAPPVQSSLTVDECVSSSTPEEVKSASQSKIIAAYREALRQKTSFLTFRKRVTSSHKGPNQANRGVIELNRLACLPHTSTKSGTTRTYSLEKGLCPPSKPKNGLEVKFVTAKTSRQLPDLLQIGSRNSSRSDIGSFPCLAGQGSNLVGSGPVLATPKHPPRYDRTLLFQANRKPLSGLSREHHDPKSSDDYRRHYPTKASNFEDTDWVGNRVEAPRSNKLQESEGSLAKTNPEGSWRKTKSRSVSSLPPVSFWLEDNKAHGEISSWDAEKGSSSSSSSLFLEGKRTRDTPSPKRSSSEKAEGRGHSRRELQIRESPIPNSSALSRRKSRKAKMSIWDAKIEPIPQKPPRAFSLQNNNPIPRCKPSSSNSSNMSSSSQLSPHSSCSMTSSGASSGTLSSLTSPQQAGGVLSPSASSTLSSSSGAGMSSSGASRSSRPSSSTSSVVSSIASAIENQFHTLTSRNNGNFRYSYESPSHKRYNNNHFQQFFQPQRPSSHHGTPIKQSRQTSNLLASLDKSILQIRDWLTLLEDMLQKERVDLGDLSSICRMLDRQRLLDFIKINSFGACRLTWSQTRAEMKAHLVTQFKPRRNPYRKNNLFEKLILLNGGHRTTVWVRVKQPDQ